MSTATPEPLVSIGIPTYERADRLRRALSSAQAQTHRHLEIVISDNGSADETASICRAAAADDPRIRYLRREQNQGSTVNFNTLFEACRGDYVLLLADDDWLDPGYVEMCLGALRAGPGVALAGGWPRYVRGEQFVHDGVVHEHTAPSPGRRVVDYLETVEDNGIFYGLMPREVLARAAPLLNVLGNDWLHVARIACQGEIRMRQDVRIHREVGGTSVDIASILSSFGRAGWQSRIPQLVIAWQLLRDIGWKHPIYERLGGLPRLRLALRAALASMRWRALAWHLVTPAALRLAQRPRGRPLWTIYDRITRALGAGGPP